MRRREPWTVLRGLRESTRVILNISQRRRDLKKGCDGNYKKNNEVSGQ